MYDYQFDDDAFAAWVLMHQTWYVMRKSEERKLAKVGLTPERLQVLSVCTDYPGTLIPEEISRLIFRDSQSVSGLLNRMERDGLVRRVPKRKGHPFTEVHLTPRGEELCPRGIEAITALVTKVMSCLSAEELEQLQKLLRKLRQNTLEELHLELMPPPSWAGGEVIDVER